jgi:hypothetical protein
MSEHWKHFLEKHGKTFKLLLHLPAYDLHLMTSVVEDLNLAGLWIWYLWWVCNVLGDAQDTPKVPHRWRLWRPTQWTLHPEIYQTRLENIHMQCGKALQSQYCKLWNFCGFKSWRICLFLNPDELNSAFGIKSLWSTRIFWISHWSRVHRSHLSGHCAPRILFRILLVWICWLD